MLILLEHMGRDYIVWDKAASIQFLKPGRGMVTAAFHISPEQIADLRAQVEQAGKIEPLFNVECVGMINVTKGLIGQQPLRREKRFSPRK